MKRLDFDAFPRGGSGWDAVMILFPDLIKSEPFDTIDFSLHPVQALENELSVHIEEDLYYFVDFEGQALE